MGTGVAGESNSGSAHSWAVGALERSSGGQGGRGGLTPFSGAGKVTTAVGLKDFLGLSRR